MKIFKRTTRLTQKNTVFVSILFSASLCVRPCFVPVPGSTRIDAGLARRARPAQLSLMPAAKKKKKPPAEAASRGLDARHCMWGAMSSTRHRPMSTRFSSCRKDRSRASISRLSFWQSAVIRKARLTCWLDSAPAWTAIRALFSFLPRCVSGLTMRCAIGSEASRETGPGGAQPPPSSPVRSRSRACRP